MSSIVTDRPILPSSPNSSSSSATTSPIEAGIHPHPSISIDRVDRRAGEFGSTSSSSSAHSNNVDQHRFILHPTHHIPSPQPPIHHSQHTPSTAARRHRPTEVDSMDTTRRINYRPTALPMDHERNVDDEAGGARWLSEDEGGETARKTTRAGSFGEVAGGSRAQVQHRRQQGMSGRSARRTAGGRAGDQIDAGPPSGSGLGLGFGPTEGGENANRLERDAWGVPSSSRTGGWGANEHDQSSRSGLEQAKAHWKSVGTSSRMRLRRAVSSELVTSPTATTTATMAPGPEATDDAPASSPLAMSGHPIAPNSGMPMPGLRTLAPPPKPTMGGISTYQAEELIPESSGSKPRHPALDVAQESNSLTRQSSDANAAQALSGLAVGDIPDFATGRGGDGIGGSGVPPATSTMTAVESVEESLRVKEEEKRKRKQLLDKLSDILKCPCCPIDSNEQVPFLNHPVTLFCGHTVSSSHVRLPQVPVPDISGYPATDAFGIMEAYQARRLALWAKVPCPLPGCKNYIGQAGSQQQHNQTERTDAGAGQTERTFNVHGVAYYPPLSELAGELSGSTIVRCPPPSDLSGISTDKTMMDVSVAKILALVWKQMSADAFEDRRLEMTRPAYSRSNSVETVATETDGEEADAEDEGYDEDLPHKRALPSGSSSRPGESSRLSAPGLTRTSSKRRRQKTDSQQYPSPPHKRSSQLPPGVGSAAVGQRPPIGRRKASISFEKELCAVMECDVCAQILHLPVTTPCQHTFCSKCLARSLDHSSKCPLCRQDLPAHAGFQELAVNKVLTDIVIHAFPEEHAERMRSIELDERDARLDTPIFVCALAFPNMPTILHVFEPRYRLMLRRCIESGTPRFGMVLPARGAGNGVAGVLEYGTMLDIKSIQMLPDGRSMVETMGSHRFRLLEKGSLDGYTVGRVEKIEDIPAEDETALEQMSIERARARASQQPVNPAQAGNSHEASTRPSLPRSQTSTDRPASSGAPTSAAPSAPVANDGHEPSTAELMGMCKDFIEQLRSGSAPWLLQRLNSTYGPMPEDASTFSYWMALVMPIDEYEKARLLPIRSPRLRLRLIVHWVEQLRSSWWFSSGCVVG